MPVNPTVGSFPLSGVAGLPNVSVAFPGEHWSDRRAVEEITPGSAVVPVNDGGKLGMRLATGTDSIAQMAIALRTVDIPDSNSGIGSRGPNEVRNLPIAVGEYVHAYYSGAFHLTLVSPAAYEPGMLIGWDADGARPTGKPGTGAWAANASADIDSMFEVMEFRPYSSNGQEGILTVRSLRGQF